MKVLILASLIAVCTCAKLDNTYLAPNGARDSGGNFGLLPPNGAVRQQNGFHNRQPVAQTHHQQQRRPQNYRQQTYKQQQYQPKIQQQYQHQPQIQRQPQYQHQQQIQRQPQYQHQQQYKHQQPYQQHRQQHFRQSDETSQQAPEQVQETPEQNQQLPEQQLPEQQSPDAQQNQQPPIGIISYENQPNNGDGSYKYSYETENGIKVEEEGEVKNKGTDNEIQSVRGSYSYTGPDGVLYTVNYIADENGFQPQGDHIPTLPVVPGNGEGNENGNGEGYPPAGPPDGEEFPLAGGPDGEGYPPAGGPDGENSGYPPSGAPDTDQPFDPTNSNGLPTPQQQDEPINGDGNGNGNDGPSRPQGEYLPPSNDPGVPPPAPSNTYIPASKTNARFTQRNRY